MATSFAVTTVIPARNIGMMKREALYKHQWPNPTVAAGHAWDLSADFEEVHGYTFGPSAAVTDHGLMVPNLIGTLGTYGYTPSTIKLVGHQTGTGDTAPLDSVPDSDDHSAVTSMLVTVYGY